MLLSNELLILLMVFGISGTGFDKREEYTVADGFFLRRAVC
jgi:hypothetical protein